MKQGEYYVFFRLLICPSAKASGFFADDIHIQADCALIIVDNVYFACGHYCFIRISKRRLASNGLPVF
jgi:hypothetical protein